MVSAGSGTACALRHHQRFLSRGDRLVVARAFLDLVLSSCLPVVQTPLYTQQFRVSSTKAPDINHISILPLCYHGPADILYPWRHHITIALTISLISSLPTNIPGRRYKSGYRCWQACRALCNSRCGLLTACARRTIKGIIAHIFPIIIHPCETPPADRQRWPSPGESSTRHTTHGTQSITQHTFTYLT